MDDNAFRDVQAHRYLWRQRCCDRSTITGGGPHGSDEPSDQLCEVSKSALYPVHSQSALAIHRSADMWGAGMLAYMILCARLPFGTEPASVSVADLYSGAQYS